MNNVPNNDQSSTVLHCPTCDLPVTTNPCINCGTAISDIPLEKFEQFLWDGISQEFCKRLMIDEEWIVREDESLTWWPSNLPQTVFVSEKISIEPDGIPDVVTRVTVETELGRTVDEVAVLAELVDINIDFPFGSFLLIDGMVLATFSVCFNSRNKTLIRLFCDDAIIQTTVAHEVGRRLSDKGLVELNEKPHPVSGLRTTPDEFLELYKNEDFSVMFPDHEPICRDLVRQSLRNMYYRDGLKLGFENEEMTFFSFEKFDCGIGWRDTEPFAIRFGKGLLVWNNIAVSEEPFTDEFLNWIDCVVAAPHGIGMGHIGSLTSILRSGHYVLVLLSYLSYFVVETTEFGIDGGAMTAMNAVHQANASARLIAEKIHS